MTFEWKLISLNGSSPMDDINITTYTTMDPTDGSLSVDVNAFRAVLEVEAFSLVFRGLLAIFHRNTQSYIYG